MRQRGEAETAISPGFHSADAEKLGRFFTRLIHALTLENSSLSSTPRRGKITKCGVSEISARENVPKICSFFSRKSFTSFKEERISARNFVFVSSFCCSAGFKIHSM